MSFARTSTASRAAYDWDNESVGDMTGKEVLVDWKKCYMFGDMNRIELNSGSCSY
jgi:hypothetical protein